MAESSALRVENYQKLFNTVNSSDQEQQITEATRRGEVYGARGFHHTISQLISRVTKLAAHDGSRKSESYKYQAG